jgi:hypothetical protein
MKTWRKFRYYLARGAWIVLSTGLNPISGEAVPNTAPLYSRVAAIAMGKTILTANTAKDGTGTVVIPLTADATNGGRCPKIVFKPLGTNVATVARIFINNGATNTTASNNSYLDDVTLPASTLSEVVSMPAVVYDTDGLVLPPGYQLLVTIGTTVAAGYAITVPAGTY